MSSPAPDTPPRRPQRSVRLPPSRAGSSGAGTPQLPARRDPAIAKALQLSTFEVGLGSGVRRRADEQDAYSTEDFVSTLSEKLIAESKANPGRELPSTNL